MTSDPHSYIESSVALMGGVLGRKNSDYRIGGEFSNFEQSAVIADITPLQLMTAQIAIKLTRIQGLGDTGRTASNESLKDSYLDLAGYALIAHAYIESREAGDSYVLKVDRSEFK